MHVYNISKYFKYHKSSVGVHWIVNYVIIVII